MAVDFLIITPLDEERDAVLKRLPGHRRLPPSQQTTRVYYEAQLAAEFPDGQACAYRVIVMPLSQMGHTESSAATAEAIREWQPHYVLIVGIAGGNSPNEQWRVKLGDVLIAEQFADYELQKQRGDSIEYRWQVHRADPRLLSAAKNFRDKAWHEIDVSRPRKSGKLEVHYGTICTGNKVIVDDSLMKAHRDAWAQLIGVEMESGGVAHAAFQAAQAPGFFMVRGVSDLADAGKDSSPVRRWRSYAREIAASYAIALLKSGPVPASESPEPPKSSEPPRSLGEMADVSAIASIAAPHATNSSAPLISVVSAPPPIPDSYRDWLRKQCAKMELFESRPTQSQAVRLDHLYVPAITSARLERAATAEGMQEGMPLERKSDEPQFETLLERLSESSLYVPGSPGSGKSTFCRWVAYVACADEFPRHAIQPPEEFQEPEPSDFQGRLALLVPLRNFWKQSLPLEPGRKTLTERELTAALCRWIDAERPGGIEGRLFADHLSHGTALLILDGVDEVPSLDGDDRVPAAPRDMLVAGLAAALPQWIERGNRVLVTARPYGLTERQERELGLPSAEVSSLPQPLRELFIRRWFDMLSQVDDSAARGAETARAMVEHLASRSELDELTANPLLLTSMCVIFGAGGRLPKDRHALYQRMVEIVLSKRYPNDPSEQHIELARLSVIAYGMHTGEGLDEQRLQPQAEATVKEIIDLLRSYQAKEDDWREPDFEMVVGTCNKLLSDSGLLLPRGRDRAAFYHLTIQEFLAAQQLLELTPEAMRDAFLRRSSVAAWHATLSFAFSSYREKCTLPDRPRRLVQALLERLEPAALDRPRLAGVALDDEWETLPEDRRFTPAVGLALVVGDCLEVLQGHKVAIKPEHLDCFQQFCLAAIERNVSQRERVALGRVLGRVGDPRVVDLRRLDDDRAYVTVPARDDYVFGDNRRPLAIERPFRMSRYPVTNAQYRLFLKDRGYDQRAWWSDEGWKWKEQEKVVEPAWWRNHRRNGANQPVVGVSYHEAEAFAKWAGGRLPTEQEWEAAARGPAGFAYPWGNDWNNGICNTHECGLGITSPVGTFPKSRSNPLGLEDMAGNVWEWCASWYDDATKKSRVVRGGSCLYDQGYARSAVRNLFHPAYRLGSLGIRLVGVLGQDSVW